MRKVLALLVAAAAVVPAVAVDPQAAGGSALIQEGDRAEEKLWFHLDDLLQQQEDAGAGQAPSPADFSSGGSELSESGAPAAAQGGVEKEATAARKDKTGGSTTVLSNRNFMSIMEDAEGRQLNPQLAAAEGRLEAHEAARKAAADAQRKRSSEQNGKALAAKKAKEDNERALNELAKVQGSAVEEVRKAQAKSDEINRQTLELRQKAEAELAAKKAAEWQFGSDGADFGGDYLGVVATKLGDACALEGLMRKGSTQPVLGYLPVQCRPSKRLMIAPKMGPRDTSVDKAGEAFHRAVARVDLLADGRVYLVASQHAVDWMSFGGVRFFVKDPPLPVEFMPEWSSFGGDFRSVGVSAESFQGSDGKLCTLSGLLRGNKWGYFLTLPAECRPKRRLAFSTCNGVAVTRVDVETNGKVLRAGGSAHGNWVSLDGVAFPTADAKAQNLDLADGWRHYDNDLWGPAQFHRLGNTCILTGLVTRTGTTSLLGRLPAGCRPKARLIFSGNTNDYSARVDVTPAGEIYAVGLSAAWVSLSSVSFTVTD